MEEINYERLIPTTPQKDVVSIAYQAGKFQTEYLIYKADCRYIPPEDRNEPAVKVVCSACEREFLADKIDAGGCGHSCAPAPFGWLHPTMNEAVVSGMHTLCPICGAEAKTLHVGNMGLYGGCVVDDAWVATLSRLPVEGKQDRLVLTDWCVRRAVNKRGATRHEVWPYTAWVAEEKKIVRLMGYRKTVSGDISMFGKWQQRKNLCDVCGAPDVVAPWDPRLLEGTTAANCKLDLYQAAGGRRLVSYLALWKRRPAVENLLVQGCGALVEDWIKKEREAYGYRGGVPKLPAVNWKEKRPARMLRLSTEEFRLLRDGGWSAEDVEMIALVRARGEELKLPEDLPLLRSYGKYVLEKILSEKGGEDFRRILRYLQKQKCGWDTLRDYWRMAERLDRDLTDGLVRWPRDLRAAHDRAAREQKHRKDELLAAAFAKRASALEGLSFQAGNLLIRPCRDQAELIGEGKKLHHCVANYAQDHADGRTAILFIRRADEPEEPYFTLEFDEKKLTVRQNRGLRNCGRTPEVEAFEAAWLKWVKTMMKKGKVNVA